MNHLWTAVALAALAARAGAAVTAAGAGSPAPDANRAVSPSVTGTPAATATPHGVFFEGFESPSGVRGWAMGGTYGGPSSWLIVAPAKPPAHDGERALGTHGAVGLYRNSEDSFAMTPPWAIPPESDHKLTLHHWYDTDEGADGGRIEVTTDRGQTWEPVNPRPDYPGKIRTRGNAAGWPAGTRCFTGSSAGWQGLTIPLEPYVLQVIRFRFRLSTDEKGQRRGWYVDDLRIL